MWLWPRIGHLYVESRLVNKAIISRIRPISWKICIQGKEEAEYVRGRLAAVKLDTTECERERDLADPPVYSFVASYRHESPLTSSELQSILVDDDRIEVAFDAMKGVK